MLDLHLGELSKEHAREIRLAFDTADTPAEVVVVLQSRVLNMSNMAASAVRGGLPGDPDACTMM